MQRDLVGIFVLAIVLAGAPAGLAMGSLMPYPPPAPAAPAAPAAPPLPDAPPPADAVPILDQTDLFSDRAIRTWSLELPEARWAELQRKALDEAYVPARLVVEGVSVGVVGVRFKGGVGTLTSCFRDGERICPRLSLKIGFDEFEPGRRFFGLERLNFHAMRNDSSMMRERLAYWIFEQSGVHAPRTAWARIVVNGESQGIFAVVEQVDGRFTDRRFHGDDGLLYKHAWPTATDAGYYEARLRTNRGEPHDHEGVLRFARELAGSGPGERRALLERWMDVDYALRFMAVDRLLGNWDGVTAWYCDGDDCANGNYYWYQAAADQRLWLIPWDMDGSLALFDPAFRVADWMDPAPRCDERPARLFERDLRAPGCDPLMAALAETARGRIGALVRQVLAGPLAPGIVEERIGRWRELLAAELGRELPGPELARWQGEVDRLLGLLDPLRRRGETLAAERPPSPLLLSLDRVNDFEDAEATAIWESVRWTGNPRSTVSAGLGAVDPLRGRADLRLAFELRNDSFEPASRWMQWASLELPFAEPVADLSDRSALRVKLRSDAPREVRIDLESPLYEGAPGAVRYGWTVRVAEHAREVLLPMAELRVPEWADPLPRSAQEVMTRTTGLSLNPQARGRRASGYFGPGESDRGFLEVDDIEFLRGPAS